VWPILLWAYILGVIGFLYVPLVPPLLLSLSPDGTGGTSLKAYLELWKNPILMASLKTSLLLAILTGALTPPLALLAAMGVRELKRASRGILLLMLLPLFVPGITMGLASAFFFRFLGVDPSLWTILIVHVLWAMPFAFLIVLTAMSTFDPLYLEAAYALGANRVRAFLDVELPLIRPGLTGAAIFSAILSVNETVRTSLVQGPLNTVQTYIWSTYLQVGLSPPLYALMSLLILLTFGLLLLSLLLGQRRLSRVPAA
jgi:ABC-type spermidine/putrescine transport system permease subunit II